MNITLSSPSLVDLSYSKKGINLNIKFLNYTYNLCDVNWRLMETLEMIFADFQAIQCDLLIKYAYQVEISRKRVIYQFPKESTPLAQALISTLYSRIMSHYPVNQVPDELRVFRNHLTLMKFLVLDSLNISQASLEIKPSLKTGIHSPRLYAIFKKLMKPHRPEIEVHSRENPYWQMKYIYLNQSQLQITRDFFKLIARRENFEVIELAIKETYWIRDLFFYHPFLKCGLLPSLKSDKSTIKDFTLLIDLKNQARGICDFSQFGMIAERLSHLDFFNANQLSVNPIKIQESLLYFEGGNILFAINRKQQAYFLCGAHNLLASYILLEQQNAFRSKIIRRNLDELIKVVKESNFVSQEDWMCTEKVLNHLSHWVELVPAQKVWEVIGKIEVVKALFQQEFGREITFIESGYGLSQHQIEFHLDLYMLPGPDGIIYLQSYKKCVQILEGLLDSPFLSLEEKKEWVSYLIYAKGYEKECQGRLNQIKRQLENLDFVVVEVPARYATENKGSINYLNAILGEGKKGKFAICNSYNGLGPGELYLRYVFSRFLKAGGIKNVYFIKGEVNRFCFLPKRPNEEAIQMTIDGGGLHCLTQRTWGNVRGIRKND